MQASLHLIDVAKWIRNHFLKKHCAGAMYILQMQMASLTRNTILESLKLFNRKTEFRQKFWL